MMNFLKGVGVVLAIAVVGVGMLKFLPAYVHVHGIEGDLNGYANDLAVGCVGDPECEDNLIDQIEMIREANKRDVELDYDTLDYSATGNKLYIDGSKEIDLWVDKYTWHFQVTVELLL